MTAQRRRGAVVLLLIGAALAALLLFQHHGEPSTVGTVNAACGAGETSGCDVVAQSAYSKLAGFPLAGFGLAFYLVTAALLVIAAREGENQGARGARIALGLTLVALAADVVLFGLQAFVLKAFCKVCLATYAVNAGVAACLWPARSTAPGDGGFGRVATPSWAISLLAIAAGVFATNAALEARAAQRQSGLLGAPATNGAGAPGGDAALRAQVERLQATLDDPQKFQEYQTAKAEREFETATPEMFDLAGVPTKGPADARISVIEFSDFLCPFCRQLASAFQDFLPRSAGRISVRFKNYPLDKECNPKLNNTIHVGACWLARGGICANQQGRFWAYHDQVFQNPPEAPGRADVLRIATLAGVDGAALGACLDSPATNSRLSAEIAEAERAGVKSTPTLFINGKKLPRVNDFLLVVEKESARLGLPPLSPQPSR
jgi:protein-disulfide isomerase/uncharacterized membrane protein